MLTCFIIILTVGLIAIWLATKGNKVSEGLPPKSMYRIAGCLVIASIISGTISLFAVVYALKSPEAGLSDSEVIVDIFSILVTVLMGWNIISLVDFKRREEKIDHLTEDFQHVIQGILRLNIKSFMMIGDKYRLLDNCFASLNEIMECRDESIRRMATDEIMHLLHQLYNVMKGDRNAFIIKGKRGEYLYALNHIDSMYSDEIAEYIKNVEGKDIEQSNSLNIILTDNAEQNGNVTQTIEIQGSGVNNRHSG